MSTGPATAPPTGQAPRRATRSRVVAARGLSLLLTGLGVLVIVVAVLTLLIRLTIPLLGGYKGDIEAGLTNYLKRPVTISELDVRWTGRGPELLATGVEVTGDNGRRVALDEALVDVNLLGSAFARTLVINELTLKGADLAIERRDDGSIGMHALTPGQRVPARQASGEGAGIPDAISWLFNARRVNMLDTRFTLINNADGPDAADMQIGPVDFQAEYVDGEHRLRVDLEPDGSAGGRIELAIDLTSTPARAFEGHAIGRFRITADALDLTRTLDAVQATLGMSDEDIPEPWQPVFGMSAGRLSLQFTGALQDGHIGRGEGDIALTGLTDSAGVVLADRVTSRLRLQSDDARHWQLNADGTQILWEQEQLRADTLQVVGSPEGLQVDAAGTDGSLMLAATLAELIPAIAETGWVNAARPEGHIAAWRTRVHTAGVTPSVDVVVSVPDLSFAAAAGAPGVSNLALSIVVNDNTGFIEARSPNQAPVRLDWPDLYSQPVLLQRFDTVLSVGTQDGDIHIEGPVSVTSGSLELTSRLAMDLAPSQAPYLDLQGDFTLGDVTDVNGLLPDLLVGEGTTQWFAQALREGRVADGTLVLSGRASDFPFKGGVPGEFKVSMQARGVDLKWLPDWPAAQELDGTVVFEGTGFSAEVARGKIATLDIDQGRISIDDLRVPQLVVDASGSDRLPSMLDFANTGPLRDILEPALEDLTGSGAASMDLLVKVPLSDRAAAQSAGLTVDGTLFLRDNAVSIGRADIDLRSATGAIGFDQDGIDIRRLKGEWLDRPVSIAAAMSGSGDDRQLQMDLDGVLEGSDVLSHYGLPLDRFVSGASRWTTTLVIPFDTGRQSEEGFSLVASSDLIGSELRLPAPLYKSSQASRRMTVATRFRPDEPVTRWNIQQDGHVDVVVDVADGEMLSLALGLGQTAARREGIPGIRIDGQVDVLDVDGWVEAVATLIGDLPDAEADGDSGGGGGEPIPSISANLVAERSLLRNMPLGKMSLAINSDATYLNTVIQNRYLSGNARYPRQSGPGTDTPLKIRLARVDGRIIDALSGTAEPDQGEGETTTAQGGPDPRTLPPIEAQIASLVWQDLKLEGLTLRTEPDIAGLNIVALGFSHENLNLIGEGYWRLSDPQRVSTVRADQQETSLSLALQSSNFGRGLAAIGLDGLIGGGAGRATAQVNWPGPAWSPDVKTLGGNVSVDLKRGSISKLEPGAGKLIGLFAFQALPQRLNLDFSDVVNDGLAFTTLTGNATIDAGVVDATLVRLEGPIGVIDVSGTTDLATRQLDQHITVLPRISAALPIIGVISGGASAGIGVLLAGGLLKAMGVDFDRIGLREYRLHGQWEEPTLDPWKS